MPLISSVLPAPARAPSTVPRSRLVLGGVSLLAAALYFVLSAVVASAWPRPYSWAHNMISDLGVPECLGDTSRFGSMAATFRFVCSPWHVAMNVGFVVIGVLAIVSAVALRPLLRGRWGTAVVWLAVANGVAIACVGFFPGSAGEFPGGSTARIIVHPLAAYAEHVTGMALMAIALAVLRNRRVLFAVTALAFGVSGLAALVIPFGNPLGAGGTERAAIDPFLWWRVVLGAAVLATAYRRQHISARLAEPRE